MRPYIPPPKQFTTDTAEDTAALRDEVVHVARTYVLPRKKTRSFTMEQVFASSLAKVPLARALSHCDRKFLEHELRKRLSGTVAQMQADPARAVICIDQLDGLWKRFTMATDPEVDAWVDGLKARIVTAEAEADAAEKFVAAYRHDREAGRALRLAA